MKFINTDDGMIPISRVIRIVRQLKQEWLEYDANGETRRAGCHLDDWDSHAGEVIPAAPGYEAIHVSEDWDLFKMPVVGWLVCNGTAIPVTPDDAADLEHDAILYPDGTVLEPFVANYKSIDDYVQSLQERKAKEGKS